MKLIIAGSRDLEVNNHFIDAVIRNQFNLDPSEIVSGHCPTGADKAGKEWYFYRRDPANGACFSLTHQYKMSLTIFKADWDKHGKAAGPIRNLEMAEYSDALLLIWDGESKGSASMKKEMLKLNKPVYEVIIKKYNTNDT